MHTAWPPSKITHQDRGTGKSCAIYAHKPMYNNSVNLKLETILDIFDKILLWIK